MSYYRIAGNFHKAEIFAIFTIKHQLAKICSHENFFLQNVLADESSTVPLSRRSSKLSESWPILSSKHWANCGNFLRPTINCKYILGVSSLPLAWQFYSLCCICIVHWYTLALGLYWELCFSPTQPLGKQADWQLHCYSDQDYKDGKVSQGTKVSYHRIGLSGAYCCLAHTAY